MGSPTLTLQKVWFHYMDQTGQPDAWVLDEMLFLYMGDSRYCRPDDEKQWGCMTACEVTRVCDKQTVDRPWQEVPHVT